jgi:dsRNA-specific ribonuclease
MAKKWQAIIDEKCSTIESEMLGFSFHDRNLLVRALLHKAAYKHKDFPPEYQIQWIPDLRVDIVHEAIAARHSPASQRMFPKQEL